MKPTLAVVLAALALGACRNYTHFERTRGGGDGSVHDDASVQMDGSIDGGLLGDGGKTGCVLAGLGNLTNNTAVGINTKALHEVLPSPASVALVRLKTGNSTALGLYPGLTGATLSRIDDINGKAAAATYYSLGSPASSFAAILAPDGKIHVVIVLIGTVNTYSTTEYVLEDMSLKQVNVLSTVWLPSSIAFGDLDADGHPDLLVGFSETASASPYPRIFVYPGTAPTIGADFTYLGGNRTDVKLSGANPTALLSFPAGATPGAVFLAVLQQAVPDTSMTSKLELLEFKRTTLDSFAFKSVTLPSPLPTHTTTMTAADIDNDGRDDLVLGGENAPMMDSLCAITQLGNNTTYKPIAVGAVGGSVFGLQRIDWNQDGADDLFLWLQPSTMTERLVPTILQNRGGGHFDLELPATGIKYVSYAAAPFIQSPVAQACPPLLVFSDTVNTSISVFGP